MMIIISVIMKILKCILLTLIKRGLKTITEKNIENMNREEQDIKSIKK